MRGRVIADWSKVNFADPHSRSLLFGALNHFMRQPEQDPQLREVLRQGAVQSAQHFGQPGDFPTSVLQILEKYRLDTSYDDGWQQIFDVRDFTGSNRNGFELLDVEDGLTFSAVPIGHHADVYKMSGAKATVYFELFGGGLQWHRTLIDDQEYWALEDNAYAFRNKAYAHRAQIHYNLIEAVPAAQNISWQAPEPSGLAATDPTYVANRDAQTMNTAAQTIILTCQNKGYGISPANVSFIVLCPLQLRGRIRRALNLMLQATTGSERQVDYSFTQITTTMLSSGSYYYVILPKRKIKSGNRMNLTVFDQFSITSYSDIAVGWFRLGAAIGDTQQIQRCATS